MVNVVIEGWQDERNPKPISLVDAMRQHAGMSLPAAKKLLDAFAEQGRLTLALATAEQASRFAQEANAIGAIVRIEDTPRKSG